MENNMKRNVIKAKAVVYEPDSNGDSKFVFKGGKVE
jgi:hypothetical protein